MGSVFRYIFQWVLLVALGLFIIACTPKDPLDINLKDHNNLAVHIHPYVEIEILGEKQLIPAEFGHTGDMMRVIHTHDNTGKLHVESPTPHQFYLEDFFAVWGRTFNESCIFEYCVDEEHELSVFVNGEKDERYGTIPLKDGDRIKILYQKK